MGKKQERKVSHATGMVREVKRRAAMPSYEVTPIGSTVKLRR